MTTQAQTSRSQFHQRGRSLLALAGLLTVALLLRHCTRSDTLSNQPLTHTFLLAKIIPCEITLYSTVNQPAELFAQCEREVERCTMIFSKYEPQSELSRLNRTAANADVHVSLELAEVLSTAFEANRLTNGAFDITVLPLVKLWTDAAASDQLPDSQHQHRLASQLGMTGVAFDPASRRVRFRNAQVQIDLGGISKGYIVDRLLQILRDAGVRRALVNLGGDLAGFAEPADPPFRIGIQDPDNDQALLGVVQFRNGAIATSGDYERYLLIGQQKYSHIIDPRTGSPVAWSPSVTVRCPQASMADALATGFSVLPPAESLAAATALPDTDCLLLHRQGTALQLLSSPGIADRFHKSDRIETATLQAVIEP